jgi:pimeloyl-ACP methyl ester carboxylesterase
MLDSARLLFVDFDGLRTGAAASELPLGPAARVDLMPLPKGGEKLPGGTPRGYSQWLLERVGESPDVLVGYCVGASIAVQLAERIERCHGGSLTVVLIDPAEATEDSVRDEANVLLSRLEAGALRSGAGSDLGEIVAELDAAYRCYLAAQDADDREMLEEMREETLDRYAAWLAFVAAAAGRAEQPLGSSLHVIFSLEGAGEGLPAWLEAPTSVTHLAVARDDLLASTEAAGRLAEFAGTPIFRSAKT